MKKKYIPAITLISFVLLSGCASIEKGRTQTLGVETTHNDKPEPGAVCMLTNHQGSWAVTTPDKVTVRRSHKNLDILCEKNGFNPGKLSVKPIAHKQTFAKSMMVGGLAGSGFDHLNGALYDYPSPITVPLTK
jgi:hypothetical protein